jgi:Protein of unknown function (DUF1579)
MRKVRPVLSPAIFLLCCTVCLAQFPQPGPEHESLRKQEGTWDVVMTLPGNMKAKGTMTCKMECGGLWLTRDTETKFRGLTFQVKSLDGYDPVKKKYVSVQFDSMSTVPMMLEGEMEEQSKMLTQTGEARDFDGSPEQVKSVLKHIDDDHQSVEVYRVYPDGKEAKHLTIEYVRRKEAK